jgi:hypothetical protein
MQCTGFVRELAGLAEGSPLYERLLAGLLVVEVAAYGRNSGFFDLRAATFAQRRTSVVTDLQLRKRLLSLLDSADPRSANYPDALDRELKTYGMALHRQGHYGPAGDVFAITADARDAEASARLQAMYWRAFSARLLSKLDEADMGYSVLRRFAELHRDRHMELEGVLGHAKVAIHRGNIPEADDVLNRALEMAEGSGDGQIVGKAHIDLA